MINNNILISIIIPFYNASDVIYNSLAFIKKIIDNNNVEIIFIDDGSTDNSIEKIKGLVSNQNNVRLIRKKNNGVSSARNLGIKASLGKYIMFLDADDQFVTDTFDLILNRIKSNHYDIMVFSYCLDATKKESNKFPSKTNMSLPAFLEDYIKGRYLSSVSFSSCLYRGSIIRENKILFNENIKFGEDQLFLIQYISAINGNGLIELNRVLLHYFHHENNATKKFNIRRFDAIKMLDEINFKKYNLSIDIKNSRINSELCAISTQYYAENSYSESMFFLKKQILPLVKSNIKINILKYKDIVFTYLPKTYMYSYKTYKHFKKRLKKCGY